MSSAASERWKNGLRQRFALSVVRPYTRRELPGWGRIFGIAVGDYRHDPAWRGAGMRWMRGKLHGYEMLLDLETWSNRGTYFLGRFYDLATQQAVQRLLRPGDLFIDIGANEGQMALLAARLVGPGGHVIAFEPNPGPRARLEAAIERNDIATIDVRPIGLGDADDVLPLTIPRVNSGEGSFGRPAYAREDVVIVECPVRRGDDVLAGLSPKLIKIDVEGYELHALRGLKTLLREARPAIVTEIVGKHLHNAGSSVDEVVRFLADLGYVGQRLSLARNRGRYELALTPLAPTPDMTADVLWSPTIGDRDR